jgi:hypothetical protein
MDKEKAIRLFWCEIFILLIAFFLVNLVVDFLDFWVYPTGMTPTPHIPHIFQNSDPTNTIPVKRLWPEILFFFLVFFGQIAILRLRKHIFIPKLTKNG